MMVAEDDPAMGAGAQGPGDHDAMKSVTAGPQSSTRSKQSTDDDMEKSAVGSTATPSVGPSSNYGGSMTAITVPPTASTGSSRADSRVRPLLKASPPMPVGPIAGRYKVRMKRASFSQPFGISFQDGAPMAAAVVGEDVPHLGVRKGDEVERVNDCTISNLVQCNTLVGASTSLELQLYHREPGTRSAGKCVCCGSRLAECCVCFAAPEPRCKNHLPEPMRGLLFTSGPVPQDDSGTYVVQIVRTSLKQEFGFNYDVNQQPRDVSFDTQEGMPKDGGIESTTVVMRNTPHFGIRDGDVLLNINGVQAGDTMTWQSALDSQMTVALALQRHERFGPVQRAEELLQIIDLEEGSDISMPVKSQSWFRWLQDSGNIFGCCTSGAGQVLEAKEDLVECHPANSRSVEGVTP
eukprot:gnl/TRDRNA2_/TRDRNA2_158315_c0_seq7.p1 gnl/TRDRNA2_/TRDRNA2_158315_c0~~gnl/TRDRNA2_/TRDRNA2_158315_c0_seq7.p1  ORF type:complete len:407 (-),score=67.06 gnl/TRDRNA2_/TRDRNA2_158315_c0_seq7:130-1350(-)